MILNYFKTAFRNILLNKVFSSINIIGLAISMSVCLLMIVIITDQYSYDNFHKSKEGIYRVITNRYSVNRGNSSDFATSPIALSNLMREEYAGLDKIVNIYPVRGNIDANTGERIIPVGGLYVSKHFFDMFSFDLLEGNEATVFKDPFSIVLTESSVKKLYGSEPAIGKLISFEKIGDFKVTGVVKDPPRNSHIKFESLRSFSTIELLEAQDKHRKVTDDWTRIYHNYSYFTLKDGAELTDLNTYFDDQREKQYTQVSHGKYAFEAQPFTEIYPGRELSNQLGDGLPEIVLFFLAGLALVIIFSACFNYANLSIAKALTRAKEVGIRKSSGAHRYQIFAQFIYEAIIISLLALLLAYFLFTFIIGPAFFSFDPMISQVMSLDISIYIIVLFLIFAIVVGIIAGLFPALYLSKLSPLQVLKNVQSIKVFSKLTIRKALIVFQFTLSLIFIVTAVLAYRQFKFTNNFDLGFAKENIINVRLQKNDYQIFKNEFSQLPEVKDISFCSFAPGIGSVRSEYVKYKDKEDSIIMAFIPIDQSFINNMGVKLIAGENFPQEISEESERYVIINEVMLQTLGIENPQDALGEIIMAEDDKLLEVIGVMGKFHYDRIDNPIDNFGFRYIPLDFRWANVKVSTNDISESIAKMQTSWKSIDSVHEFDYVFYEESIENAYMQYIILTKIVGFCAFLAITIATLGLFGMAIYTTQTRIKEIGVRKVLGASINSLVLLLSSGFIKILLLATFIALPLAYLLNNFWLEELAYRISFSAWPFVGSFALILSIGLVAISTQTIRAASVNPVDSLRNE